MNQALHNSLMTVQGGRPVPDAAALKRALAAGADPNAPDRDGWPPLLRCLSYVDTPAPHRQEVERAVSLLLEAGADMSAITKAGLTAHNLAAAWRDSWFTRMLRHEDIRRSDPVLMRIVREIEIGWPLPGDEVTDLMKSSFCFACRENALNRVRYTLHIFPEAANWTYVNQVSSGTALTSAVESGNRTLAIVELLLGKGADVNARGRNERTALMQSVSSADHCETAMALLVAAGADETLQDDQGKTALGLAAQRSTFHANQLRRAIADRNATPAAIAAARVKKFHSRPRDDRFRLGKR